METLNSCPLCKSSALANNYLSAPDHLVTGEHFTITRCKQCDFLFTNPRPTWADIAKYYKSDKYNPHATGIQTPLTFFYQAVKRLMLNRKLALLKKHITHGQNSLIDVGCGTGSFAAKAAKNGFQVIGVENDINAAEIAAKNGVNIYGSLEAVVRKNITTNAITFWHALEHIHGFPETLRLASQALLPGGFMIIALPMATSFDAAYYGKHWAAWDLPRHLYHLTPETIIRAAKETGFVLIERKPMVYDSFYIAWLSERIRKNPMAMPVAFSIGLWSNLKAVTGKNPWSSQIFVFKK